MNSGVMLRTFGRTADTRTLFRRLYCTSLEAYFCYYCPAFDELSDWIELRESLPPTGFEIWNLRELMSLSITKTSALQR